MNSDNKNNPLQDQQSSDEEKNLLVFYNIGEKYIVEKQVKTWFVPYFGKSVCKK